MLSPKLNISGAATTGINDSMLVFLKGMVSDAGGVFIGIQANMGLEATGELWFTNPTTKNQLHIPIKLDGFDGAKTCEAINTEIAADTSQHINRKVRVSVRDLQQLSTKLLKLSEEIDALYEEKKQ